jgi:hypothetical protein
MKTLLLLLVCLGTAITARADSLLQMKADFEWFDALGFTDVRELPFVRYCYGTAFFAGGKKEEQWSNGFLQEDKPSQFRILTPSFGSHVYSRNDHDFDSNYRYEPADLRAFAEDKLAPVDTGAKRGLHRLIGGPHFAGRTEMFVLAWMCQRKGLEDLAARLYAAAQSTSGPNGAQARDEAGWTLRDKLGRDIGQFEMWRTVVAFGDLSVTRRELLARLRALPGRFPHCEHLARAASMAKVLEQMIAEDNAHPARTPEEIAALPPQDQAAEWIFRLRDQNGEQHMQPGWVSVFQTPEVWVHGRVGDSPAHQLVKLGDPAVPPLIAALGDPRLTRSVGYGRDFVFSHEVVTFGDAALEILQRIAGREFYRSGRIQGTMVSDGQVDAVRAAVQKWWDRRQKMGVHDELADAAARGDAKAAETLLADFPQDAASPILAGAAGAKGEEGRCAFIRLVAKLKEDRGPDFLLRETREGPILAARAEAAWQLAKQGRTDGVTALAQVWRDSAPSAKSADASGRGKLIAVLAMVDSPEGVRALADGLSRRTIEARSRVLEGIGPGWEFAGMQFGDHLPPRGIPPVPSAATAAAIEDLLASELDDRSPYTGRASFRGGPRGQEQRLCDQAAEQLAARWPDRYKFDASTSYPAREIQRVACLNTWRQAHGQPPLPVPERLPVAAGDEGKIAEIAFVGAGITWPETMSARILEARGKDVDAAYFRSLEDLFLEACAGHEPAGDRGFYIDVFREKATDGVTLVAGPAERPGLAEHPQRLWRLDYQATYDGRDALAATDSDLFGRNRHLSDRFDLDEIFKRIARLPAETAFHLHVELGPQRWDVDTVF